MALTGTETHVGKEFFYNPGKIRVRLVAGFDQDELNYWAVETCTGDDPLDAKYSIEEQVFGKWEYDKASGAFKETVQPYL